MQSQLPRWARIVLVLALSAFAAGAGLVTYRYLTRPLTLTVAAGSFDGDAPRLMNAIGARLAANKAHIRLKVVSTENTIDASKIFAAGKADLAVVRSDINDSPDARTVALISHGVVLTIIAPGNAIESVDGLKGKTIGVFGEEVNKRVVGTLQKLAGPTARFKGLAPDEVPAAIKAKQINALLVVIPLTERYIALVKNAFQPVAGQKLNIRLLPIDAAEAIANIERYYESYELPKGTLRGSPPLPDEDLTTLRLPFYLVAKKSLNNETVTDLTKAIMEARRDLVGEFPILAQVTAPSTEKDALIPIHPGANAYFEGEEKNFFDKYGDQLFYGSMVLGTVTSMLAALWKFMGFGPGPSGRSPVDRLYNLANRVRAASSEADLDAVEEEMDNVIKSELARYDTGDSEAVDAAALSLATHRLEHLIGHRRRALAPS